MDGVNPKWSNRTHIKNMNSKERLKRFAINVEGVLSLSHFISLMTNRYQISQASSGRNSGRLRTSSPGCHARMCRAPLNRCFQDLNSYQKRLRTALSFFAAVSYTHLRAHETRHDLVCRLL